MSAVLRRSRAGIARYVHGIVSVPLYRNAYSLVGATLVTSGVGVVFWVVAAHAYSTAEVGTDTALISAMIFLSRVAQLNLANGFNRFVPTAGTATRRLVGVGYAASITLAAVAAGVFVVGVGWWAPKLAILAHDPARAAWFVVATMVWTLFVLQDSVLTGLGEAPWVLLENGLYGLLKLVALAAIAVTLPRTGIFLAWTVPLLVLVVPVNLLLWGRLIPARRERPEEEVALRPIARFLSVDFAATTLQAANSGLMPLIVLAYLGPQAAAYVYLSWSIAYTVHFLSENVGMSLITEASRDPVRLLDYARKALGRSLQIVVPLALAIAVAAPLVLRAFGHDYASHAVLLLRLLALSAIPGSVVRTYLSVARVQRRMAMVVRVTAVEAVAVLSLAWVLLHVVGLAGVGWAWLVTDALVAAALLLGEFRTLWLPAVGPRRLHTIAEQARRLTHGHARRVARKTLQSSGLAARGWRPEGPVGTDVDSCILPVRAADGTRALLMVATSDGRARELARGEAALRTARAAAPAGWDRLLPNVLASDTPRGWLLEQRCPGVDGRQVIGDPERFDALLEDLVARMAELYEATARPLRVDDSGLRALVDDRLEMTRAATATGLRAAVDGSSFDRARAELREALQNRTLTAAVVHGDLWLGNALWVPPEPKVTAIVDWEATAPASPVVDVAFLLTSSRALERRCELGAVVCDVLERGSWPARDRALLRAVPGADELSPRAAVLLGWVQHVSARSAIHEAIHDQMWIAHNVHQVLERV